MQSQKSADIFTVLFITFICFYYYSAPSKPDISEDRKITISIVERLRVSVIHEKDYFIAQSLFQDLEERIDKKNKYQMLWLNKFVDSIKRKNKKESVKSLNFLHNALISGNINSYE